MQLTDYDSGAIKEIFADSVIEVHNRGPYREVKTGVTIDNVVVTSVYKVTEQVPVIINKIRSEKTS